MSRSLTWVAAMGVVVLACSVATADGAMTAAERERAAIKLVRAAVKPWVPRGHTLTVRAGIVPFNGDVRNPITGAGPIEVYVTQRAPDSETRTGRLRMMFNRFAKRRFLVNVDGAGAASILGQESAALHHRMGRAIERAVPVRELVSDLVVSRGVRDGLLTGAIGGAAVSVHPVITAVAVYRALQLIGDGIRRRAEARTQALAETVTWAKQGEYPTLMEAYRHFESRLREIKPGTSPLSIRAFAEELSHNGL